MRRRSLILLVFLAGCYSGPTYDEALQTYMTELQLLAEMEQVVAMGIPLIESNERKCIKLLEESTTAAEKAEWEAELADIRATLKKAKEQSSQKIAEQQARVDKALKVKEEAEKRR